MSTVPPAPHRPDAEGDQPRSPTDPPAPPEPAVEHPVAPSGARGALRAVLIVVALLAFGGVGYVLATSGRLGGIGERLADLFGHDHRATKGQLYQCPMHPTVTSDHPSNCPICGMKLVLVTPAAASSSTSTASASAASASASNASTSASASTMASSSGALGVGSDAVPGMAAVTIDPTRQQLIGLRTAEVTRGAVGTSWRTVGRIESDPTRVRKTNVKVDGFVERIFVDFVGKPVSKGQPLFTLYSPNLLSAQTEYLLAMRTSASLHGEAGVASDPLVLASRRKLELWDVPAKEIDELERTGQPAKTLTFVSPISGYVTAKNIVEGSRVVTGDTPYEITDLGMVWLMADAYESDLAHAKVGMTATLKLEAYTGQQFTGKVEFIDPTLDPKSRTLKLHIHFMNPKGLLKPGMFGEVQLEEAARTGLRIPFDAVVFSGTRHVVFLALEGGRFQPKEVQLGPKNGDLVEVVAGLVEGQKVVTRANFLVDSESRLRASLAAMSPQ